ncbi:MAG: hypothetical protein J6X18_02720 [Bacteroidales bacterium]|nr:hypothetical protein [Bacteroidales bacterium]
MNIKIQTEIDTNDILLNASTIREEQEIADSFIGSTTDEALVSEVVSRGLVDEALEQLDPNERKRILNEYMYE